MKKRLINIILLALVVLIFPVRRKAQKQVSYKELQRILIDPTGKLGDMVCTSPVFAAVRAHAPNINIISYSDFHALSELFAGASLADVFLHRNNISNDLRVIRTYRPEVACITGPSFISAALCFIAGVKTIIIPDVRGGVSPQETRPYQIIKKMCITYPYHFNRYAPRERLRVLEPLGIIENDTTKHLSFSNKAEQTISTFLKERSLAGKKLVGISPSAGNKIKEWPAERFGEVADYIQTQTDARVVIIGGPNDRGLSEEMKAAMNTEPIDTTGRWNIDELKAIIAHLDMFISVDTGPIYIAEAFNVPTINILGPMNEKEQPPNGDIHINVIAERVKPELYILNARVYNDIEARRQVKDITVTMVIHAFKKLYYNI